MFTNPRFKHLDTCDSLEEALASRTFRFAFDAVPFVEHETRALSHGSSSSGLSTSLVLSSRWRSLAACEALASRQAES